MLRVTILTGLSEDEPMWKSDGKRERGQMWKKQTKSLIRRIKKQNKMYRSVKKEGFMWWFNKEHREAQDQTRTKKRQ